MSARNSARECKKCGEAHLPPLIDDLCMKSFKSARADAEPGTDGAGMAVSDVNGAVNVLAE